MIDSWAIAMPTPHKSQNKSAKTWQKNGVISGWVAHAGAGDELSHLSGSNDHSLLE